MHWLIALVSLVPQDVCEAYKKFLDQSRTPWDCVAYCRETLPEFRTMEEDSKLTPGSRWIVEKAGKTVLLIVIGKRPPTEGMRIIGAHNDSVRLDLKPTSLYAKEGFAMLDTISYGGIKNYQWVYIPLELRVRVPRRGGKVDRITIDDPILLIADLLPHLDRSLRDRKQRDVIKAEELDPIAGMDMAAVRKALERHGITEKDLKLAEASLVPSMPARDAGLDRSLIAGYGHDDKANAFAAYEAIRLIKGAPTHTAIAYLVEKEEVGSTGNTGAQSEFLRRIMGEIVARVEGASDERTLRRCLVNTRVLSADVTGGVNPNFAGVQDLKNAARLGRGVVIKRYGRGKDANAEYNRWLADLWDGAGITYQITMLGKVDAGGGGTIARFMADDEMKVIDVGIPELSMHSPYSLVARSDMEVAVRAFEQFYASP